VLPLDVPRAIVFDPLPTTGLLAVRVEDAVTTLLVAMVESVTLLLLSHDAKSPDTGPDAVAKVVPLE
jgi:hypothetical protein